MTRNVDRRSSWPTAGRPWRNAFVVLLLIAAAAGTDAAAADGAPRLVTSATPGVIAAQLNRIKFPFTQPQEGIYYASILTSDVKFAIKNNGTFLSATYALKAPPGLTLEKINAWNREHYFSRAYLDGDRDPCLEAELDLEAGVSEDAVGRFFLQFAGSVSGFLDHLSK